MQPQPAHHLHPRVQPVRRPCRRAAAAAAAAAAATTTTTATATTTATSTGTTAAAAAAAAAATVTAALVRRPVLSALCSRRRRRGPRLTGPLEVPLATSACPPRARAVRGRRGAPALRRRREVRRRPRQPALLARLPLAQAQLAAQLACSWYVGRLPIRAACRCLLPKAQLAYGAVACTLRFGYPDEARAWGESTAH